MFDANQVLIDAFIDHAKGMFRRLYPELEPHLEAGLDRAARTALTILRRCDCPYHDLEHTLLVTEAGMDILQGRQLYRGDLPPVTWLHAVVALLFHDIGYLRGLLRDDREGAYLADATGRRVAPPSGTTDAYLMPYHVARGSMFVMERFAADPVIDGAVVATYVEMTRFPVPEEAFYQQIDSVGALVRAADLIGQMGDPGYTRKQSRLFAEFRETGEADRLGYGDASALHHDFPAFFYNQVYPYLPAALDYLQRTPDGGRWIANLAHHLGGDCLSGQPALSLPNVSPDELPGAGVAIAPGKPQIAVSNH
ncbi:MAG: metal-dependent phosphohydrolase [Pseudomonadota bacterium]